MAFSVNNHKLQNESSNVTFKQTPNGGAALKPLYLIMHYTAGRSSKSSVEWFLNNEANASAHIVIGRSGDVTQLQPFNKMCWHAGVSRWGELIGLNHHSIGIELDNAGILKKTEDGSWKSWFGSAYPATEVLVAKHRLGGEPCGWHTYTEKQIEIAIAIGQALHDQYRFLDILGHDDISWPRKTDPGPAFPLDSFRSRIMGRR
jgi:N-acetylmuramoyl-L-alanine amidase